MVNEHPKENSQGKSSGNSEGPSYRKTVQEKSLGKLIKENPKDTLEGKWLKIIIGDKALENSQRKT